MCKQGVSDAFPAQTATACPLPTPTQPLRLLIGALETNQVQALRTRGVSGYKTTQVSALTTLQIPALTSAQISVINATVIGGLTTDQVAAMETGDLAALTTRQIVKLSTNAMAVLSTEQLAFAQSRMQRLGVDHRADLRLQDYRDINDAPFDAICSIEMVEAVGREYWPTYFGAVSKLLKPGGRLITSVPNAGYCGLIAELIQGEFRYRPEGLLDNTHLRFFTRKSLNRFFEERHANRSRIDGI